MKTLPSLLTLTLLLTFNLLSAQVNPIAKDTLNKGTIKEQFDFVMRKSSNFKNYKVVKRYWLNKLKKHTDDSLKIQKIDIKEANNQIEQLQDTIVSLKTKITEQANLLQQANDEKGSISFVGFNIAKKQYKIIMWSIIAALFLALLYFIYSFRNSNKVTKDSLLKLKEIEEDYSGFRARSLEREQALNRKLLDEINKHK